VNRVYQIDFNAFEDNFSGLFNSVLFSGGLRQLASSHEIKLFRSPSTHASPPLHETLFECFLGYRGPQSLVWVICVKFLGFGFASLMQGLVVLESIIRGVE
jgi:hypothetical protein